MIEIIHSENSFDQHRALVSGAAANMAEGEPAARTLLLRRRLNLREAIGNRNDIARARAAIDVGEGFRDANHLRSALHKGRKTLPAHDGIGQGNILRRRGVVGVRRGQAENIVLIDEELMVRDPPPIVRRDDIRYVSFQRDFDDRSSQALNAMEMNEGGLHDIEDSLE